MRGDGVNPVGVCRVTVGFSFIERTSIEAAEQPSPPNERSPRVRRVVFARLAPLHAPRCPFVDLPNSKTSHWGAGVTPEQMNEMQWLKPKLVAQIRFVEWTADGHLRHSAFLGLRSDKTARGI